MFGNRWIGPSACPPFRLLSFPSASMHLHLIPASDVIFSIDVSSFFVAKKAEDQLRRKDDFDVKEHDSSFFGRLE